MNVFSSDPRAFPDSPYAAELRRGVSGRRFDPRLEREYVQARLSENRVLVTVACVLGALLSLFSVVRKGLEGSLSDGQMFQILLVLLGSVILAAIACSPLFARFYLPVARVLVPIRNVLAAAFITIVAAQGYPETLMVLPLMVIGPFFFLGLPFRVALLSVAAMIVSFVMSAMVLGLAGSSAVFSFFFLVVVTGACIVATRHLDEKYRRGFLERRVTAELAEHDALTGIKNRRVFDDHLARLWRRGIDDGRSIAVLLIDVDHFKVFNDRYGHQAGDRALCRVAETLQKFVTQPFDVLARYGGEEFALLLNDVDAQQAGKVAERMRRAVREVTLEQGGGVSARVTISVGVAALRPTPEREPRGALQLADQALYEAKQRGRDRVVLMEEDDYRLLVTGVFSRSTLPSGISRGRTSTTR